MLIQKKSNMGNTGVFVGVGPDVHILFKNISSKQSLAEVVINRNDSSAMELTQTGSFTTIHANLDARLLSTGKDKGRGRAHYANVEYRTDHYQFSGTR
ncbi:hypothetical protein ISS07_00955 [Candidatus Woesearchaeota archaeon]|nr:hypothetical protein [Candidatus Woesearchaeota archaeon]